MGTGDPLTALNPSIVGQAEKAHGAILRRILAATTLDEKQWITMNLAIGMGTPIDREQLVARVAAAAKFDPNAIEAAIASLAAARLLGLGDDDHHLTVTNAGRSLIDDLRAAIAGTVGRAYGEIPAEDLATAARVLTAITTRLSEELTAD